MKDNAYTFNAEKFAAEVFPDEIVVLDVIEGTYFSLGGAGLPGLPGRKTR